MDSFFVRFIRAEYESLKKKNQRYSRRAFANKLKVDPALLIAILSGRRKVTPKIAKKILSQLPKQNQIFEELLLLSTIDESYGYREVKDIPHSFVEETNSWIDSAVLALLKKNSVKYSQKFICKNLGLSLDDLSLVLTRLENQGWIEKNADGYSLKEDINHMSRGIGVASLNKLQTEYILKAADVFQSAPAYPIMISGNTFSCQLENLEEAKNMLRTARTKISDFLHDESSEDVYRLNIQLFPLSKSLETTQVKNQKNKKNKN